MENIRFRDIADRVINTNPDQPWLTITGNGKEEVHSLREIGNRINDYCSFYESSGLKAGDSVLIILHESIDLMASFFAGICYGVYPAYYAYPSAKQSVTSFTASLQHLLSYNEVKLLVTFKEVYDLLSQSSFSDAFNVVDHRSVPVCKTGKRFTDYPAPVKEAFLQFSSGTTGAKKGVMISSQALFNQLDAYVPNLGLNQATKIISWLPHYHDMGLIACIMMPFVKDIPVVMMSPFEWVKKPVMLLEAVSRYKGTHIWQPNFALGHMTKSISSDELTGFDLSSLQKLILCSEPVQYETVEAFKQKFASFNLDGVSIENCYAMAENTFAMTTTSGSDLAHIEIDQSVFQSEHRIALREGGRRIVSAGKPLSNIEIFIVGEDGNRMQENQVGEVLIKSNCMLDGYYNNPSATAEAMQSGTFKTGDLGFFHKGELYLTGRKKELIIVGGENIYPQDIESILNEDPALIPGRNVVFGVGDERIGTEKIVILAELKDIVKKPDESALRQKIMNALNIAVKEIVCLPHMTLKKGTAGKISRYLNKQLYLNKGFHLSDETDGDKKIVDMNISDIIKSIIPATAHADLKDDTSLMGSGLIDSFDFVYLISKLEEVSGRTIPKELWKTGNFENINIIKETLASLESEEVSVKVSAVTAERTETERRESLQRLRSKLTVVTGKGILIERIINKMPFKAGMLYRFLLRKAGVRVGNNVQFLGKIKVKFRGNPSNITIGNNVILGNGADLRIRENGKIILSDRVYLDDNVRIVAAREGKVEVGFGTEIGGNTIINSGGVTTIGEFCMIAGNGNINSSSHGTKKNAFMKEQAHTHGSIDIGNDVWIGSGASIVMNTVIGEGVVISTNSVVSGVIPEFAVCAGIPAKIIRFRD